MSFSFSVKGANKDEAVSAVAEAMAEVVKGQPIHARDQLQVGACADGVVSLLQVDPTREIVVSVSGSLGWRGSSESDKAEITSSSINVSAWLGDTKP